MKEQTKADILIRDIKDYIGNQYELAILKATDKVALSFSKIISWSIVVVLLLLSFLFFSFYFSFYFSETQNNHQGFLWMGAFYLILLIVFRIMISRPLKVFLHNKIIFSVLKNMKS